MKGKWKGLLVAMALFAAAFAGTAFAIDTVEIGALPSGQIVTKTGTINNQGYIYHRIEVPKAGILQVNGYRQSSYGSYYAANLELCNASWTLIDYSSYNYVNAFNDDDLLYAVKKGVYYIRLEATGSDYQYLIGVKFTAKGDKGGKKKSKAFNLKRGKTYSSIIPIGSYATKWFKIQATGKKKEKVVISLIGRGNLKLQATGPKLNDSSTLTANKKNTFTLYSQVGSKKVALRARTYYLKITNTDPKYSGWLQIKLKK